MAKITRRLSCSYLTTEGTLYQVFEELRDGIKIGESADLVYGYAKVYIDLRRAGDFRQRVTGRIVFHAYSNEGFIPLAKGGTVYAIAPTTEFGSESTKKLGLETQYVKLTTKNGLELSWNDVISVMGSAYTVQHGTLAQYGIKEGLVKGDRLAGWDRIVINKVSDLRKEKEVAA